MPYSYTITDSTHYQLKSKIPNELNILRENTQFYNHCICFSAPIIHSPC